MAFVHGVNWYNSMRQMAIEMSEVRFSEVLLLLYFTGDLLSNIIMIPSNITDPDFAPRTILHAHVRIS
jgi:hypothetical protein